MKLLSPVESDSRVTREMMAIEHSRFLKLLNAEKQKLVLAGLKEKGILGKVVPKDK